VTKQQFRIKLQFLCSMFWRCCYV